VILTFIKHYLYGLKVSNYWCFSNNYVMLMTSNKGGIYMTIKTGESMLAADMLNLAFCPRGMILMYDGTNWTDNVTLKGWYQCKGGTVNGIAIPDLREKFIMGYNGARSGGANNQTLSANQVPSHTHGFTTSDPNKTLKGTYQWGDYADQASGIMYMTAGGRCSATGVDTVGVHTLNIDATHTHSGRTDNQDGKTNGINTAAFDNRPAFYALIYIIKVTEAGQDSL
jgi:microcystin-dependent protein